MLPKTGIRQIYTATGALGGVQTAYERVAVGRKYPCSRPL